MVITIYIACVIIGLLLWICTMLYSRLLHYKNSANTSKSKYEDLFKRHTSLLETATCTQASLKRIERNEIQSQRDIKDLREIIEDQKEYIKTLEFKINHPKAAYLQDKFNV